MLVLKLFQVLLVFASVDVNKASLSCKDEPLQPPVQPHLSSFTQANVSIPNQDQELWVHLGSLQECAQFCLEVSSAGVLNCTGFRYGKEGRCLVKTLGCMQRTNTSTNLNGDYILKDHIISSQCVNISSPVSVSPSTTLQVAIASTLTALPNKDTQSYIVINVTAILLDVHWNQSLLDSNTTAFHNLSASIKHNILQMYSNDSTIVDVISRKFRNDSSRVLADFSVLFNSSTRMHYFRILYRALYRTHSIHGILVKTVWDNLPGKPPINLTVSESSDTTAVLSWTHAHNDGDITTLGYSIMYTHKNANMTIVRVTGYRTLYVRLKGLKAASNYSIQIMSIMRRGFGEPSLPLVTTTSKKVLRPKVANITFNLLEQPWIDELSNRTHPDFISLQKRLTDDILLLNRNKSKLREITVYRFRRHTINGSRTVVQAEVMMSYDNTLDMLPIYTVLYRTNNVTVSLVQDNIPGKPVTNITWTSSRPDTVSLNWSHSLSPQCGYIVYYKRNTSMSIHNVTINSTSRHATLTNLHSLTHYVIWIQSITVRGPGLPSDVIYGRTLEKVFQVNLTLVLLNQTWISTNFSSQQLLDLSVHIQHNVSQLFVNESQFRNVACVLRNTSSDVIADVVVQFGQDVSMSHFVTLYEAVYVNGRLGNIAVKPLTDTIPGKPPKDLSASPTGTTTISVTWSPHQESLPLKWLIFYELVDPNNVTIQNNTLLVEKRANQTSLNELAKFAYYVIWMRGVTAWGYGIPSEKVFVRTLEDVLSVQVVMVLPTIPWDPSLLNSTSQYYSNVSHNLVNNIKHLYSNDTQMKEVKNISFTHNTSTTVHITLVYGQYVKAKQLNQLYEAVHKVRRIGGLVVEPVTDTIPGKPPDHVTASANSTTSVLLTWSPVFILNAGVKILKLQVFYMLTSSSDNESTVLIESNTTSFLVRNLKKFRNYTFWVTCVTRFGTGSRSVAALARTFEEFVPIDLVVRFPSLTWNGNLSLPDSQESRNLSEVIQQNVFLLYGGEESQLRRVVCHRFRNGSVIADLTIVYGQHVNMTHFATLYKALYVDGQLYNLSVQPLRDTVPGKPPINVTTKTLSSTSIRISWSCSDCNTTNNTIAFLVTYRPSVRQSNITQSIVVNSTVRHVTLSGLHKFTMYTMWVTSVTSRGKGIASSLVYSTTLQDVPSRAPNSIQAFNTSSTSIEVAWSEVAIGYVHGILQGYVIQYRRQTDLNGSWTNATVAANVSTANITSLDKYTHYVIRILAFTVVGWGPSRNVTVSTDEDVPSRPPSAIVARNTSSTSIEVTWDQVPRGFAHGVVLGYHVLFRRANDSNSTYMMETTNAQTNRTLLTGLNKYTEYRIRMTAFTLKGNGSASREISVYTDEDTPSLPPPNVQAYNTSSTSLNVTWGRIIPSYFIHGILRGYRLLWIQANDVNGSYSNVTTLNNSYEITRLEKFTGYLVKVLAYTIKGDGVVSLPLNVSTDEDVPNRAPLNLIGHNTSSTSLYLMWDPVPRGFVHGILRGYKVIYKIANEGLYNYTNILRVNTTREAALIGLRKFTMYRITVLAFTVKGDGPAAFNITTTTDEDIPSLPPTNLTAHNTSSTSLLVKWNPVPLGHLHGILRGYQVFYKMAVDTNGRFVNVTSGAESSSLTALKKYTVYLVKVLAFTVKGDGPLTSNISVSTDEDVPSRPPQNVSARNTSSTSLYVTWADIPEGFVHGILLGYRVEYSIHRRRSDRSVSSPMISTVASPSIYNATLRKLDKFTEYNVEVLGYTRIGNGLKSGVIRVTTDEDVPSKPPQNLNGHHNGSSTSLKVHWDPVPKGFVHGVLLGYRLMYKVKSDKVFVTKKLKRSTRKVLLYGLLKYTYYDIKILAFTRIGNGVVSSTISRQTDEDVPSMVPPNVNPTNKASSTSIPITWSHIPTPYVHGILRGYHIRYELITLADNKVHNHTFKSVKVGPDQTNVTLRHLESYATYKIRIAGYTIKGDGVWDTFFGTTCRCHSVLPTNWFAHPPYVRVDNNANLNESTFNGLVTPVKGIFPPILDAAIIFCCGECSHSVVSPLDFYKDGYGKDAQKKGLIQVKDRIDNKSFINFPIGGTKGQTKYHGNEGTYEFLSIMDMPGAAFLVADRRQIHSQVLGAILSCWPAVIFVFLAAYLAGGLVWIIDVRFNPDNFPRSFIAGIWEGFWWAFITMTTVGYGDRIPKSIPARLFTVVWIWTGIVTIAVLTSSITASLMSMVFQSDVKLYGTKVAAIDNSSEYKLGVRRNAFLDVGRKYGNIKDIYEALESEHVHAALLDSYATASQKQLFSQKWLRVRAVLKTGFESTYGVVLSGDSMKLGRCMRDYMKSESHQISRVVQKNVETIKTSKIPPAVKTSSDLLTAESQLFKLTAMILGGALGVMVTLSLSWEFLYRRRKLKKDAKKTNNNKDPEGSWPFWAKLPAKQRYEVTRAQCRQDLDNFYNSFKATYDMLRKKHSLQIQSFKNQTKGIHYFSMSEWTGGRSATYSVTQDGDVNSILDGLDLSMFDGQEQSEKKTKLGL